MVKRSSILVVCLLLLVISAPIKAQSPTNDWQIPHITCNFENCVRQNRVDEAGNLYVYVERFEPVRQEVVYVIERNSSQVTEYDLAGIHSTRGVLRDFVPFANGKLLIVEYQVPNPITLVDLHTRQATSLDVDFVPWPCHDSIARIKDVRIQRVGQDGVLFCSSGRDGRTLVLTRLQNDTFSVEDTLAMGFSHRIESGIVPLWRTLADGLDGKIYIVPFPGAPILSQVTLEYEGYDWSDYVVLRYDPATQQWDSVFIETSAERWNVGVSGADAASFYVGVDRAGNMYFSNSVVGGTTETTDFIKYNPQGEKVWHLTEADFGQRSFKPFVVDENQFILDFGMFGQSELEFAVQEQSTHFLLVDENNAVLAPLTDSLTVDRNQFPTAAAIRVETAPAIVGSVLFDLNGVTTIDNEAPYTLPLPGTGTYTLTATPHAEANGQGKAGTPLMISFEVTRVVNNEEAGHRQVW